MKEFLKKKKNLCLIAEKTCHGDELRCNSGECVSEDYVCDHQNDCEDGSDELNCTFSHGKYLLYTYYKVHLVLFLW